MKKILLSLGMVAFVGAVVAGATGAFFSDTETSTGNTFSAGEIDLQIDNTSYVTNNAGVLVASPANTWTLANLTNQLFFSFADLKPGDVGEDTISVHAGSNDAWACMAAKLTSTPDNGINDPEATASDVTDGLTGGELQNFLNFSFWNDDGDNVYEVGEGQITQLTGPASTVFNGNWLPLADSANGPVITGNTTRYIGKAWCFGTLTPAPVAQGESTTPLVRGTGFTCNGSGNNNIAQTDGIVVDVSFQAVQARNNGQFTCASLPPFQGGEVVRATVGAALASYTAPTGGACNVTVTDEGAEPNTITEGIAAATVGQTVCVLAGTYPEDVLVNKDITLSGAGAATTFIIGQTSGEAGAVVITADGATVEGFDIIDATGGVAGLRISGAHTGITIDSNRIQSVSGFNAFLTDGGQSNHTISNNDFVGNTASQLVYVNGNASVATPSTNVDFTGNTFSGTATGPFLGIESNGSSITLNKFSGVTSYTSIETFEGNNLVNQNNFNVDAAAGPIHVVNGVAGGTQFPGTLNAENNWWGDTDPSDNTTGLVDSSPSEASALPQN